jgi:hypothetical protein
MDTRDEESDNTLRKILTENNGWNVVVVND